MTLLSQFGTQEHNYIDNDAFSKEGKSHVKTSVKVLVNVA